MSILILRANINTNLIASLHFISIHFNSLSAVIHLSVIKILALKFLSLFSTVTVSILSSGSMVFETAVSIVGLLVIGWFMLTKKVGNRSSRGE